MSTHSLKEPYMRHDTGEETQRELVKQGYLLKWRRGENQMETVGEWNTAWVDPDG